MVEQVQQELPEQLVEQVQQASPEQLVLPVLLVRSEPPERLEMIV
jgi:hypothetical protein